MHEVTANGYDEVRKAMSTAEGRVFVLFTGSKVDGKSWCPDCVMAEPIVDSVVRDQVVSSLNATFITCFVGTRDYWKDPACPFRTDPVFKLTCIPTLIEKDKKYKRLLVEQLRIANILKDFFCDDS